MFELVFGHLSVCGDDAGLGHEFSDGIGDGEDVLDAVVYEVYLSVAGEFANDSGSYLLWVVCGDLGDDAASVEWRGG